MQIRRFVERVLWCQARYYTDTVPAFRYNEEETLIESIGVSQKVPALWVPHATQIEAADAGHVYTGMWEVNICSDRVSDACSFLASLSLLQDYSV
jgi:hypothetical protein